MRKVTIEIDEYLYEFYRKLGMQAGGLRPEKVMVDALFKLAGELSLQALHRKNEMQKKQSECESKQTIGKIYNTED